nr:MAG TPA: hypothetical protein [Caudoviricetes sp.]
MRRRSSTPCRCDRPSTPWTPRSRRASMSVSYS